MAGLRHPTELEKIVSGQKAADDLNGIALSTTQPLQPLPAEGGIRTPGSYRNNMTKEHPPTAPNTSFCFRLGQQSPGQSARPYQCAFALPRGSTSGVEPATAPHLERRKARLRHPSGNIFLSALSGNSGQLAAGVSTAARATEGESNPKRGLRRSPFSPAK